MTTGRINQISVILIEDYPKILGSRISRQYIINKPKLGLLLLQTNSSNFKFIDVMALRVSVYRQLLVFVA